VGGAPGGETPRVADIIGVLLLRLRLVTSQGSPYPSRLQASVFHRLVNRNVAKATKLAFSRCAVKLGRAVTLRRKTLLSPGELWSGETR
jgi:hypothetical protein